MPLKALEDNMKSPHLLYSLILAPILLTACAQAPAAVPEEAPAAPVRLETVKREAFQPELTVLGTVQPGGTAEVIVPAGGRVLYPGRFPAGLVSGVEVRAGEVLARVSLQDAEAGLAEARLRVQAAESELARHQRAFDAGVEAAATLSSFKAEADLAHSRLSAAQDRLGRLDLRAPLSGRLIVDRRIAPDSEVAAGAVLARIAAGGALRVEGRAAAADRDRLHPGLAVRFAVPGSGAGLQALGAGVVREVAPVVDAGGTVSLVAEVTDPLGLPAPGEGVELRVALDRHEQALTVPEEALVVLDSGSAVFVTERGRGRSQARRRPVDTGARGGGRIEILRGLSPGDKVVIGGAALLADGDVVTPVADPAAASAASAASTPSTSASEGTGAGR
jgi:RND family efflux transporter MFP subunit